MICRIIRYDATRTDPHLMSVITVLVSRMPTMRRNTAPPDSPCSRHHVLCPRVCCLFVQEFHECPTDDTCTLPEQVSYYMNTYTSEAGIPAAVGFEIGTPAYPDPVHDASHQLPLTRADLDDLVSTVVPGCSGAFMWELFKAPAGADNASPTDVAQALCTAILPGSPRCTGTIPPQP
jgi:hypothetical protein